jgi:hypothetical protein
MSGSVAVRFGEPIHIDPSDDPMTSRSFVDALMYEIRMLSGQEYVDSYVERKPRERVAA